MMNDPRMSRAQAEAGEREWARQAAADVAPEPTTDPGVVILPPPGVTRHPVPAPRRTVGQRIRARLGL